MKISKMLVALGIVAFAGVSFAQATQAERELQERQERQQRGHNAQDRALNPQPLPPRDHRWDDTRDHRQRDRDFRTDRDHRRWNDYDHRRNYEVHRSRLHELRVGMRKSEVLRMPWWQHPLYVRDNGPFDTYIYADGRHGKCVLSFQFNRLAEIDCD